MGKGYRYPAARGESMTRALAYLCLRVSSALALLSVGIDALSIAIPAAPSWFWLAWETSAQALIFYRAMKGETNE
jgi:hypothetical protein